MIEKCSQHYIMEKYLDEIFVQFTINTEFGSFISKKVNLLELNERINEKNKSINIILTFKNDELGKKFELPCIFKSMEEERLFIIYSDISSLLFIKLSVILILPLNKFMGIKGDKIPINI